MSLPGGSTDTIGVIVGSVACDAYFCLSCAVKMREIITASSAAGVAVAFGSPIGGVLFSIEEMNQTFSNRTMWQSFVCALVATFTLAVCFRFSSWFRAHKTQYMDPFRTGKLVLFQVSYDRDWHYFEIPAYMVIGLFGVRHVHLT